MSTDLHTTFWSHFVELRITCLRALFVMILGIMTSFIFYEPLISFFTDPLKTSPIDKFHIERLESVRVVNHDAHPAPFVLPKNAIKPPHLPSEIQEITPGTYQIPPKGEFIYSIPSSPLVVLGPLDGMFCAMKVSLWTGLAATSPIWLFILMQFIIPALRREELRLVWPFLGASLLFIGIGLWFALKITIPIANEYLMSFNETIGVNLWTLDRYLDYTLFLLLANGFAFELGVVGVFAVHLKLVTMEGLIAHRRFAILGAFILGALLTPPDVLTQFMLAIPLIGLYEFIILYARFQKSNI